ncbi:MAG: TolC family protein [Bacteroidetes bacterium]|nr:TolC family protein [Bacteroidota bacterium]MCB0843357.1 TolC family protein [Bacteroidota bacterium]
MYRYTRSFLLLTILAFLLSKSQFVKAQGNSATEFTLEDCIQYALQNNKTLQNARFDEYIADASVKEIISSGYPQINGSADLQYFASLPTSILPGIFNPKVDPVTGDPIIDPETGQPVPGDPLEVKFGFPWQSTAGIQLNQLIFDGTFFIGLQAAKTFVELSEVNTSRSQEEVALAVSKAYYQALISEEQLNLIDANIERLKTLYTETQSLNEAGFVEKIDVDRLNISYNNLKLEKSKVERFVELSKSMLKFQMGMPISEPISFSEKARELMETPNMEIVLDDFDPNNRIEFTLLSTRLKLENYNLRRYRAGYMPSLYGFTSMQWNAQRDEFNLFSTNEKWFPIAVMGLQLNIPIFDGFRKHQQIQQSKLAIRKIENEEIILQQSVSLEIQSAVTNLNNSLETLNAAEKNVELAREVYRVSQIKYKEGVGSSLELNDAETQLKQAESSQLSGMFEYLMAKLELQKAKGEFSKYHTR